MAASPRSITVNSEQQDLADPRALFWSNSHEDRGTAGFILCADDSGLAEATDGPIPFTPVAPKLRLYRIQNALEVRDPIRLGVSPGIRRKSTAMYNPRNIKFKRRLFGRERPEI